MRYFRLLFDVLNCSLTLQAGKQALPGGLGCEDCEAGRASVAGGVCEHCTVGRSELTYIIMIAFCCFCPHAYERMYWTTSSFYRLLLFEPFAFCLTRTLLRTGMRLRKVRLAVSSVLVACFQTRQAQRRVRSAL